MVYKKNFKRKNCETGQFQLITSTLIKTQLCWLRKAANMSRLQDSEGNDLQTGKSSESHWREVHFVLPSREVESALRWAAVTKSPVLGYISGQLEASPGYAPRVLFPSKRHEGPCPSWREPGVAFETEVHRWSAVYTVI